jgi:threonine dehydrogenase-like Zn-dependent dehydrogenase
MTAIFLLHTNALAVYADTTGVSIENLITSGGALGILAAIVLAFYANRVMTKSTADDRVAVVTTMWEARFADERAEKEAWKSQAQQLAPAVAAIAEELSEANRRDDDMRKLLESIGADRRRAS